MKDNLLFYFFFGITLVVLLATYFVNNRYSDSDKRYFCYPQEESILPDGGYYSCLVCVDRASGKVDESCKRFEK